MASMKDFSPFVPFDIYDFFGYLFPGVLFSISIIFFYNQLHPGFYIAWFPTPTNQYDIPFVLGLTMVMVGMVILYSLGHVIATVSHIIIDRVLIDGVEGYPVAFLLNIKRKNRPYSEATFKYLFAMFNAILLAPTLPFSYAWLNWILAGLMLLVLLLIVQRIVVMVIHQRPDGHMITDRIGSKPIFLLLLKPSELVIDRFVGFLRKLLGLDRTFSDDFVKLYAKKYSERFSGLEYSKAGSENYWLPVFATTSADNVHDRTLKTWLHLYGFARNAAAALFLSSFLIIGHIMFNQSSFTGNVPLQLGFQWFLAVAFGLRYWILYSHYYTKGVIRAFMEIETRKPSSATA